MQLTFCGAARQVTGSCYLLETDAGKGLVDCGMFQGEHNLRRQRRMDIAFSPGDIQWVLLTHAHLDHCGLLPRLTAMGFKGEIICTAPTAELAAIVLEDSAKLQEEDAEFDFSKWRKHGRIGPPPEPLYTAEDVRLCLPLFRSVSYNEPVRLNGGTVAQFLEAGHIIGASSVRVETAPPSSTTLVFSGDIGYSGRPILNDPQPPQDTDYLVMESTYGDRIHEPLAQSQERFAQIVERVRKTGGKLIIPTFAIGRAQELLYDLATQYRAGKLGDLPIYLDSPMAIKATELVSRHLEALDEDFRKLVRDGQPPFQFPNVRFLRSASESMVLNDLQGPAIIMAGSGMCTGGRIRHHLLHHIENPKDTILFVGYQAFGTLGRLIQSGAKRVTVMHHDLRVRAKVETIEGFSAHAGQPELLQWISPMAASVRCVFLTHGEPQALAALSEAIRKRYNLSVMAPELGDSVDLAAPEAMARLVSERGRDLLPATATAS